MSEAINTPEQTLHKVFIANLNFKTTNEALESFLSDAGKVLEVIIIKHGRRSMGYGFAAYGTLAEAEKASKELSQKELDGREIRIQVANPQEAKKTKKLKRKRASKKSRKNVSRSFLRIMLFLTLHTG
jgi:RNA recognition motif-containing protein